MTDTTTPWIHLAFDEQVGDRLWDISGHQRNAVLQGKAQIVEDDTFGSCLELAGGSVKLPDLGPEDIQDGITVLLWIRHGRLGSEVGTGNVLTLGKFGAGLTSHRYGSPDTPTEGQLAAPGSVHLRLLPGSTSVAIASEQWVPIALKWKREADTILIQLFGLDGSDDAALRYSTGGTVRSLADGLENAGFGDRPADFDTYWIAGPDYPVLGFEPPKAVLPVQDSPAARSYAEERSRGFHGRMAHLRIYPRWFGAEEIEAIRRNDLSPAPVSLDEPLPVELSLENEQASPALFIDATPGGHSMTLRIDNNTGAALHLSGAGEEASADRWHFRLIFRPGTLQGLDSIHVATPGFSLAKQRSSEGDSLYLHSTAPNNALGPEITLGGLVADGRQGTRPTRIQMHYRGVAREGTHGLLRGTFSQHLDLINHTGRREVPVHVGFVGPNRVGIGSKANLRLRVTNILPEAARPGHSNVLRFDAGACIRISFDERVGTDWALAGPEAIKTIQVRYAVDSANQDSPEGVQEEIAGPGALWKLGLAGLSLQPVQSLEILLLGVAAEGTEGHSNVYVDLINIPGYWDARFACAIEKVRDPQDAFLQASLQGSVALTSVPAPGFGGLVWPAIKWDRLTVFLRGRRVLIPYVNYPAGQWRALFLWAGRYEGEFLYPNPTGLLLKPSCALYAKIDPEGTYDAGQTWIFFGAPSVPEESRPSNSVFIASWDQGLVTTCDGNVANYPMPPP